MTASRFALVATVIAAVLWLLAFWYFGSIGPYFNAETGTHVANNVSYVFVICGIAGALADYHIAKRRTTRSNASHDDDKKPG